MVWHIVKTKLNERWGSLQRVPRKFKNQVNKFVFMANRLIFETHLRWKLRNTKKQTCNPEADVGIHTVLCHQDLYKYILAVKSFLRFFDNISICVHDDGSLDQNDIKLLSKHLVNIRIIGRLEADTKIKKILRPHRLCNKFRELRANSLQIFDFNLLTDKKKIIGFDSDLLFMKSPDEVIEWIKGDKGEILYNCEKGGTPGGRLLKHHHIECLGDVNCGFICYFPEILDLNKVEIVLKKIFGKNEKPAAKFAQNHFDHLLKNSEFPSKKLDTDRYYVRIRRNDFPDNPTMIHFVSMERFKDNTYLKNSISVIKALL